MRIRLQLLLPLAVGLLVGLGFILAAATVGDAVRGSLTTVPGLTRERAVEGAVRAVLVGGLFATLIAVLVSVVVARMVVVPLTRMQAAQRLAELEAAAGRTTPVAEIQDVARDISRATEELRDRHGRTVKERDELAALVEAVSEGIIQLDAGSRIVRVNRAAHRLLGLPDEAVGRAATAMVRHPELRRLMARGAAGERVDPAEVALDDRRVLVAVVGQPGGGAVATVMDLTDLRRLEEIRRDFVANASHELKTPLTSIRGYTETLLAGELGPGEQRQFLATVARNAERLQRIVDDLLDLSRLESGRWRPEPEPLDLLDAAERCWSTFADRAADQRVSFETAGDDDTPAALADRRALEQVFANLFDNALRHTPAGGRVTVRVARWRTPGHGSDDRDTATPPTAPRAPATPSIPAEGGWLVVEVSDTGSGIPRDALPRIFERFYRVDPARSRAEGGTGLGLSIVRHMMESMGGAVSARSELGKGTTIRLRLPTAPTPAGE